MLYKILVRKHFFSAALLLMIPAVLLNFSPGYSLPLPASHGGLSFLPLIDTGKTADADDLPASYAEPKIEPNRNIAAFIKTYVRSEAEFLDKMRSRSETIFPKIEAILSQYDLPLQLKYLAIVESKLQKNALSPAGARGLWQLMPATAKGLGLRVSGKTDERLQVQRSTAAAARYLKDLYRQFGDWLLVLAAYNCGPGAVYKAIKKSGSKNYWALQRYLPAESRGHVKRFIGIHYYFEDNGSIATLTKKEAIAWQQQIDNERLQQTDSATLPNTATVLR